MGDVPLSTIYLLSMNGVLLLTLQWCFAQTAATSRQQKVFFGSLLVWLVVVVITVSQRVIFPENVSSAVVFGVLLLVVGVVSALGLFTSLGRKLGGLSPSLLLLPQGLRAFFGAGFLIEGINAEMPSLFAALDGLTHITAAILALMTAALLDRRQVGRGALWLANVFGLTDIVIVAAGISFVLLRDIGPHHNVFYAALFAAPIFIALHVLSIRALLKNPAAPRREANATPVTA